MERFGGNFSSQITEVINRNDLVSRLLRLGFNAYLPVFDSGVDLVAYRESDSETRLIQLKGRWTIDRKYLGRSIWVAFPHGGHWYLAPHDEMVAVGTTQGYCSTASWEAGTYNVPSPGKSLLATLEPWRLPEAQ